MLSTISNSAQNRYFEIYCWERMDKIIWFFMDYCHGKEISDSEIRTETNQNIWEEVFIQK